ncbi:MAG TPA: peroxidase-related enzyme [Gammaproteobacteria bacterium]|nr:peroxidase-related enzyme [Gammaproteobacteria bacterium]
MTWIRTLDYAEATGRLKQVYERVKGPGDNIDNILKAHSLRPHTLEAHMYIYKYVLHHHANRLPKWLLEAIGVYVSALNRCGYCVEHHSAGLRRLLGDDARHAAIADALAADRPERAFAGRELAALRYARSLTLDAAALSQQDIAALRVAGLDDGEILEVNQVAAYFAYANRTVLGLGVTTKGDILGLSPGDSKDPDNWSHG